MKTKVIFAVQGEGRGHMTQALSLKQLLDRNGFEVCCVLVGSSERREIPAFFQEKFPGTEVIRVKSPNFILKNNRGIRIGKSVMRNLWKLRTYLRSARLLKEKVKEHAPQLIINFYEPVVALYCLTNRRTHPPVVSIAHQYLGEHPEFKFPDGYMMDKYFLKNYTAFTAFGSSRILALSFYPLDDVKNQKLKVVPPLLRREAKEIQPTQEDFLLCYLVNAGYRSDIESWHAKNPSQELHVFTDMKSDKQVIEVKPKLFFHKLNDVEFLRHMAACKGLISSAGFESICEAMYLGKPVLMVPVEGHFEQRCNSRDGFRAGAGIYDDRFDITRFLNWLSERKPGNGDFRTWESKAEELFLRNFREVLNKAQKEIQVEGSLASA
ncbi:MAG TPA: glycosyltransferase family protein [Bacteroidia bacterium]|nr:glycosyltransferase family protein [Bacteroidia bacterium]